VTPGGAGSSSRGEKFAQQGGGGVRADAADHLWAVVALGVVEDAGALLYPAGLGVAGAIDHPCDPSGGDGGGADRARLQSHPQLEARQAL
jgi:hypothetical protein